MKSAEKTKLRQNIEFYLVFQDILDHLPERSREIVAKRFGVATEKPMTLQAIGDEYSITRERVRQIVQSGLKSVRDTDSHEGFDAVRDEIIRYVDRSRGIAVEDHIINELGGDTHPERGAVRFFIEGLSELDVVNSRKFPVTDRVIISKDFDLDQWHKIHEAVKNVLNEKEKVYTSNRLHEKISDEHENVEHDALEQYLEVSREINQNPFKKWGLVEWDEVSPRGVREKALLIMKEKKKPMHFREIAEAIDKYNLGKKGKKSHPQTVHNELIRDDNFVLVGRGVYTLNNDDYVQGTVKDVIENILQNAEEPLTSEEVVDRVLKMRYVKPSTVKVNLNAVAKKLNKKYTLDTNAR